MYKTHSKPYTKISKYLKHFIFSFVNISGNYKKLKNVKCYKVKAIKVKTYTWESSENKPRYFYK